METISKKILDLISDKIEEYAEIPADLIPFNEYVIDACKANYCGNYGKRWSCPPAVGDFSSNKLKVQKYSHAFVFTTKHTINDSFDIDGMNRAREEHKKIDDIVLVNAKHFDSIFLSAGACSLCKTCAYPLPCRFSNKMSIPIEAYGISVVDLAKIANIRYYNGINTITYFSLIAF